MSTQTNKMVDVAMVTVAAAETEEAIGVGSGSGEDSEPSRDPELQVRAYYTHTRVCINIIFPRILCVAQEQIRHVRVTASEIQKLTPQLLSAADMALTQGESSATSEHLNLLSQEWATKVGITALFSSVSRV